MVIHVKLAKEGETAGFSGSYREGIKSFEFAMDKIDLGVFPNY